MLPILYLYVYVWMHAQYILCMYVEARGQTLGIVLVACYLSYFLETGKVSCWFGH